MLEWILDREGHEFLIHVDREFIKDKMNLIGIKEKFIKELNGKDDELFDKRFKQYIKHLYKSAEPSPEHL